MHTVQVKGSWQRFKGMLRKHWVQLADNDLLGAAGADDKFRGAEQERYSRHNDEAAGWTEDW